MNGSPLVQAARRLLRTHALVSVLGGVVLLGVRWALDPAPVSGDQWTFLWEAGAALGSFVWLRLASVDLTAAMAVESRLDAQGEPLSGALREPLFSAPRRSAVRLLVLAAGVLVVARIPWAAPRALWLHGLAMTLGMMALWVYPGVRIALRPLVEALPVDPGAHDARGAHPASEGRPGVFAGRVVMGVALPVSIAALAAMLVVSVHLDASEYAAREITYEVFREALSLEPQPGESPDARRVVARVLYDTPSPAVPGPPPPPAREPVLPSLALVLAALSAGALSAVFARRLGDASARAVDAVTERLLVVETRGAAATLAMLGRPAGFPEVRAISEGLVRVAGALEQMEADGQRALTVRAEAARLRAFILASVSHDLRVPLNGVLGFAELLLSGVEGPLNPSQRDSVAALVRGARDLLRLVQDLLDHARLDAGRMPVEHVRVLVDDLVEEARQLALLRTTPPEGDTRGRVRSVVLEGESGMVLVGDAARLAQALGALLAFALVRPGSNGHALLRTRGLEDAVLLTIVGGGTSVGADALARMLEPLEFAPSDARAPAGLGLAVAVAQRLVLLHGGAVQARPHAGGGIEIEARLPLVAETPETRDAPGT